MNRLGGPRLRVILLLACLSSSVVADDSPVVIFTMDFCPSCLAAKHYMKQHGLDWHEMNIDQSARAKQVFDRLGGRGVPMILVNGERMYGFDPDRFESLRSPD